MKAIGIDREVESSHFLTCGDTGSGKALERSTPVLTPAGWVAIGTLSVGDEVIGRNGRPVVVTGVFPQGVKPAFRVTFDDETSTVCCEDHLWAVSTNTDRYRETPRVYSLAEIRNRRQQHSAQCIRFSIPIVHPIQFEERSLPVDPYLLGALIGNGSLHSGGSVMLSTGDEQLIILLRDALSFMGAAIKKVPNCQYEYRITCSEAYRNSETSPRSIRNKTLNPVVAVLSAIGLRVLSPNKFIPGEYLLASVDQRLALFQGLMDTDGYGLNKGMVEYSTTSARLAKDVADLARSLGCVCRVASRAGSYTAKGVRHAALWNYRLYIRIPDGLIPFRVDRKKAMFSRRTSFNLLRIIEAIEPLGDREMVCITVDAPDGLFVVNDYIVTHNSSFGRQLLYYIQRCGDAAVVLDSKLEFIPEFYDPIRGDRILNPKDKRCPYMNLGAEVSDEAESMSVMRAFYPSHPDHPNSRFFDDWAMRISSHLVSLYKPDYRTYGMWLQNPEKHIYPKLKGTEHEGTLNKNASNQQAGIQGTLNEVGTVMRMMPGPEDGRERLVLREWGSGERLGWIFIPNPAHLREALRPLISGWVDMLIRFVMSAKRQHRRVWFVLDELDTLNGLPAVAEGMTQMRNTGNPMVLGMQNTQQLEDRYGKKANTIMSQAYTKIVLATSEPNSKKSLSELIGEGEFRRYRMSSGRGSSASGPEEFRKPIVMASEIGALKNLHGYFVQRGEIVKIQLPYVPPRYYHPAMIERELEMSIQDGSTEADCSTEKSFPEEEPI